MTASFRLSFFCLDPNEPAVVVRRARATILLVASMPDEGEAPCLRKKDTQTIITKTVFAVESSLLTMTDKFKGKVKWYSIRKAWGYVTPTTEDAPTTDDIFFHQTSINSEEKNKWLVRERMMTAIGWHFNSLRTMT